MITLKLTRDETRFIATSFLPFMLASAFNQATNAAPGDIDQLGTKIMLSLLHDVNLLVKRKLLTRAAKFSWQLEDHYAIAFYMFMMKQPIDEYHVYACLLRQRVCNALHEQLMRPVTDSTKQFF